MANDAKYLNILITRTMYCERCAKRNAPLKEDFFIVYGTKSRKYKVLEVKRNAPKLKIGFTPHLVQASGLNKDGNVVVLKNCAINGCGIKLKLIENGTKYSFDFKEVIATAISVKDWEALLNKWKDTGYEI